MFSGSSDVTVVLTSCGRFDLLRKTLTSFFQFNTYPVNQFIITEDSGDRAVYDSLPDDHRERIKVIVNNPRLGQIKSIDLAYSMVETPYIFHCEDDWEFYRPGFIEDSKVLLEKDKSILLVWLRSYYHDIRIHSGYHYLGERYVYDGVGCCRVMSHKPDWQGFSFNPGLRRLEDYRAIGKYGDHGHEKSISKLYRDKDRYAVIMENDAVAHLGFGLHSEDTHDQARKMRRRRRDRLKLLAMFLVGFILGGYFAW